MAYIVLMCRQENFRSLAHLFFVFGGGYLLLLLLLLSFIIKTIIIIWAAKDKEDELKSVSDQLEAASLH